MSTPHAPPLPSNTCMVNVLYGEYVWIEPTLLDVNPVSYVLCVNKTFSQSLLYKSFVVYSL